MTALIEEAHWAMPRCDDWAGAATAATHELDVLPSFAPALTSVQLRVSGTLVPCPPPMPTPEELSPVNTSPSSPNSVQSDVGSPSAEASAPGSPEEAENGGGGEEANSDGDGNYSESEEKPRKRRGRKRKLGTDDPEELKAIHNLNEKKRRADQRRLFAQLRKVVPGVEEQAQKTVVLQRVYEYLKQQEHTIEVQRKKLLNYESQLGIPHERPASSPKGSAAGRAARGARRSSTASEA